MLDIHGLSAALEMYLAETQTEGTASHHLEDNLSVQPPFQTRTILYGIVQELLVYCIVQELLANLRMHAQTISATFVPEERDQGYGVRVSNDGIGFVPEQAA